MPDVLEAADAPFRLTLPIEHITKLDDGTLLVHTVATDETPDSQAEIVDYDAAKAAAPDLMKWATLGEMHDPDRMDAGTILKLHFDDGARRIEADLHVVDPTAVRKVLTRVYKAVSIGGVKLATTPVTIGGRVYRKITRLVWDELSLVNRGANPNALIAKQFVLAKRAQEPDMTDADAGTTSPLEASPAESDGEALSPQQAAIDEVRAALAKRDVPQAERDAMDESDFAGKGQSFPIRKPEDVRAAAASIGRAGPDNYSADELRSRITAIARRKGPAFAAQLPKAWRKAEKRAAKRLTKDGNPALDAAAEAIEAVGEAMATEAAEQAAGEDESEDMENLQAADEALHEFQADESAEPGEDAAAEPVAKAAKKRLTKAQRLAKRVKRLQKANRRLAKARKRLQKRAGLGGLTRTLAKAGARNSRKDAERIAKIHDLTTALGFDKCMAKSQPQTDAETVAEQAPALAKSGNNADPAALMREALAGIVPADRLDAMMERIAALDERSRAQGETLEKIAKGPSGGGPATPYAPVFRGQAAAGGDKGSLLAQAAEAIDDPVLKQSVGEAAALETIRALRRG